MKIVHEMKRWFTYLTESKPATIILSVAVALLIWFTISITQYPTTPVTFYNIPVVVETAGTPAAENGLDVISCDVETVNVQIEGSRSKIGVLSEEDLTAYAVVQNVTGKGEYTLDIDVRSSQNVSFEVKNVTPSRAKVTFDQITTRSFEVIPSFPNIKITSGHIMNEVTCDPATIEIKGPSALLDEIDKVYVTSDKTAEIDTSYVLNTSDVTLYNKDNSILDGESLEIPKMDFKINIPILTQKELALTYIMTNVPDGFDSEWLMERLELSEDTITLASSNSALAQREDLNVGFVALEEIGLDYSAVFDVKIEEGEINQSGFQQVSLKLNNEGLKEREFSVSGDQIVIINAPGGYDFEIITENLNNVKLIGPAEQIDELSAADIRVSVNLKNYTPGQSESFSENAQISVTNASNVWAVGAHKVALNSVERSQGTTSEESE